MAVSPLKMWVDFEPFSFGIIQAHTKLSKVYLKKVLTYARGKGCDGGFPVLSWSVWRHMAINKMLIPERSAWAYFSTFHSVRDMSREERLEEAELMQQSFESNDKDLYKSKLCVKTFEFVLHLYMQQSSKTSLRTSLVGEEWPRASPRSRSPSPDSLESPKFSGTSNILEDSSRLSFVLSHLSDIIDLLCEPDLDTSKADKRLSLEAVHAFSYIIKVYLPKLDSIVPLHSLAIKHRYQNKSGYSRLKNDFSARVFENWVRSSLTSSPFALNSLLETGKSLPWTMPTTPRRTLTKRWRVMYRSINGYGNAIVFLHCSDQTICQQSSLLKASSLRFIKCNKSHFYMLSPLRSVSIEKCHNAIFVLGPTQKCVRITASSNITLIVPTRSVIIGSSNQVIAHVASPSRPLIIGESSSSFSSQDDQLPSVTLAPYHTYYDLLESHLAEIGLVISPQIDKWNNPMCVTHMSSRSRESSVNAPMPRMGGQSEWLEKEKPIYRILPPSEFFTFVIPFQSPDHFFGDKREQTSQIPWGLPGDYATAVKEKQALVKQYKLAVRNSKMTKAKRKQFQSHVETRFKEWLATSGNKRQLDDLVEITRAQDATDNANRHC